MTALRDEAPTPEQTFAGDLVAARSERGMTQAVLGQAMRRRGFPWSQATVWSVESGARSIRLNEAVALGELLDIALPGASGDLARSTTLAEARRVATRLATLLADA